MTDKEKLESLLAEFGVGFEQENNEIICREGRTMVAGYCMFFTLFDFNEDGSFKEMGAWE